MSALQPIEVVDADVKVGARQAAQTLAAMARLCREDPAMFSQFVMKHEKTGGPIKLAPMHLAWHDLLTSNDRLVIWSHTEAGKTNMVSIARVLWEVGRDPSLRVLILSNTHTQAAKITSALAAYIEGSAELHMVFPDMLPTKRTVEPWKPLSGQLTVRRPTVSKDATITASGVHGAILGARYDLIVIDDVLDFENTRTPGQRKAVIEWLQSTVQGRLTALGRMVVVGTAFHPDDVLHHYARQFSQDGTQRAYRYPVMEGNVPRWPEAWPQERIDKHRAGLPPAEFARQMLCEARDDAQARFKREWIDKALTRGRDLKMVSAIANTQAFAAAHSAKMLGGPAYVFTGVDLAVQQHSSADLTVLFTIFVYPNGDREVVEIQSGRWAGPEIVQRIIDVHHRYQSIVIVENNAAQDFILQFTRALSSVPVRPFTTGRTKAHPEFGIEGIATEMMNGKWIIPCAGGASPEVQAWVQEMLYYDPQAHTGDRLMACFFAREGARQGVPKAEVGRLDLLSR